MRSSSNYGRRAYALASVVLLFSCSPEFDTTRVAPARGSLGEEIYKVLCERLGSEENPTDVDGSDTRELCAGRAGPEAAGTPRLRALAENRERVVTALDTILPPEIEDDLQNFMVQLLPFYEPPEDYLPRSTRAIASLLETMSTDYEVLEALERLGHRRGYRPLRIGLGVGKPLLSYPRFDDLAVTALGVIADDGVAHDDLDQLLRAVALEMATVEPAGPRTTEETTLEMTRRLLFTEDDAFASGTPRWVLRRDYQGNAAVATAGGAVPFPFADTNSDGVADVDSLGRYVDSAGLVLDVPTPFRVYDEGPVPRDGSGRALRSDGTRYYDYFDADRTMLAAVSREAATLFDPDENAALNMMYGVPALLGPEVAHSEVYGATTLNYEGSDPNASPLFDLLHAAGPLLGRPETEDALAAVEILLRDHQPEVAALVEAGFFGDRRSDMRDAALEADNNLWDDVLQVVAWIAREPGLLEAMLRSFADPRAARLGPIYGEMMRYRDDISYDPSNINRLRTDATFSTPVDRSRPDLDGNQSLFQRSLALIHDLSGVKICNKAGARLVIGPVSWPLTRTYDECELLEVENVAETFALAIIGRADLELKDDTLSGLLDLVSGIVTIDDLLESQTGIDGLTTHPTPEALARLVFAPRNDFLQNVIDPPQTRDGVDVEGRHQATIFAWEREFRFTDGFEPSRVDFYVDAADAAGLRRLRHTADRPWDHPRLHGHPLHLCRVHLGPPPPLAVPRNRHLPGRRLGPALLHPPVERRRLRGKHRRPLRRR